jgi:serine protease
MTTLRSRPIGWPAALAAIGATFLLFAPRPAFAVVPAPSFGEPSEEEETVPGEIAVDLRDDVSEADVAEIGATYGISLRPASVWGKANDKIEVADVAPPREGSLLAALSRDRRVEHVEPMSIYRVSFVPNDPLYTSKQWHLQRVGAEAAWRYTCGQGVTVAVVDTGVACFDKGPFSRGTDLGGTRCEGGWNFVDDSPEAYDDHGHGTHVAGTIAQTTHNDVGTAGLAFCATLMPVKVLNRQGFGTVAAVAEGIRYAADAGAQIVNLSLGGPIRSRILEAAVEHALAKGVVVVAAAGNTGRSVGWPAAYSGVVAVSASDADDAIAWFSSRGPQVSIAAPGVAVTQQTVCNGGRDRCEIFATFNGTSMAAPHVAGVAAMIEALGVTDGEAVRAVLASTARPMGDSDLFGAGIVDARAATSRVFWTRRAVRALALLVLAGLVSRSMRRRRARVVWSVGFAVGAVAAAVGLLPFLPLLGTAAPGGYGHTMVELASRPLGEWDLVLGSVGLHRWLLLASALPALGMAALGFTNRFVRPVLGGIALGTAAFLIPTAWAADVAFVGGTFMLRVWSVAHALVCLWLARASLEAGRRR